MKDSPSSTRLSMVWIPWRKQPRCGRWVLISSLELYELISSLELTDSCTVLDSFTGHWRSRYSALTEYWSHWYCNLSHDCKNVKKQTKQNKTKQNKTKQTKQQQKKNTLVDFDALFLLFLRLTESYLLFYQNSNRLMWFRAAPLVCYTGLQVVYVQTLTTDFTALC